MGQRLNRIEYLPIRCDIGAYDGNTCFAAAKGPIVRDVAKYIFCQAFKRF